MARDDAPDETGPPPGPRGYPVLHFSLANPAGPDENDVPLLLRRMADALAELGDIEILDITYEDSVSDTPSMTVYFAEKEATEAEDLSQGDSGQT